MVCYQEKAFAWRSLFSVFVGDGIAGGRIVDPMVFSYGEGEYRRASNIYHGQIILSQHKIYLRADKKDLTDTFIPLEKIWKMRFRWSAVEIAVILSPAVRYTVVLKGRHSLIHGLMKDVAARRCFKKKLFGLEWIDSAV